MCIVVRCILYHFWSALKSQLAFILLWIGAAALWCDVMVWAGFWCEATLFSALCSSDFCLNIHRDESPLCSHTLWMKLCSAGDQQRLKGPDPVVGLFVYCAYKYSKTHKTYLLSHNIDCVQIILHGMLTGNPGSWWSSMSIIGSQIEYLNMVVKCYSRAFCQYCRAAINHWWVDESMKYQINHRQSINWCE